MAPSCTATGRPGKKVGETTLSHLLREGWLPFVSGREWYFCADPDCDVVYFTPEGETLPKEALRLRVGLKERASPRPLCYCFGYGFEDVEREAASSVESSIAAEITEKCRQGLDRCEETNPQGSCCLGNVRRAFAEARARSVVPSGPRGDDHDCCNAKAREELP